MNFKHIITFCGLLSAHVLVFAQSEITINPTATFMNGDGEENQIVPGESYTGSAPLTVRFAINPENIEGRIANYEWRFYTEDNQDTPYLVRYEEETEYTFTTAAAHRIVGYAIFVQGNDTVAFTHDYWEEVGPFAISISESRLNMPNAFSPNGDDINDVYKAKDDYQSLIQFDAYIFNRWGVKLYEWHDPAGGWDGKYKGKDVAQGVYFVLVKAKGADGREFNIRRDVNLLRGYREGTSTSTEQ